MRDIDVRTAAGPILLKVGHETKWRCFGAIFEISSGQENQGFNRMQKFFHRIFQITSRFVLAKKNLGVRCTLICCAC